MIDLFTPNKMKKRDVQNLPESEEPVIKNSDPELSIDPKSSPKDDFGPYRKI